MGTFMFLNKDNNKTNDGSLLPQEVANNMLE